MCESIKWREPTDLVGGRRHLQLVLQDANGKELSRVRASFGGNDREAEQRGLTIKAMEVYRRAFCEPPHAVAISLHEGEVWVPWHDYISQHMPRGYNGTGSTEITVCFHAMKFSDGRVWDAINGWRS